MYRAKLIYITRVVLLFALPLSAKYGRCRYSSLIARVSGDGSRVAGGREINERNLPHF